MLWNSEWSTAWKKTNAKLWNIRQEEWEKNPQEFVTNSRKRQIWSYSHLQEWLNVFLGLTCFIGAFFMKRNNKNTFPEPSQLIFCSSFIWVYSKNTEIHFSHFVYSIDCYFVSPDILVILLLRVSFKEDLLAKGYPNLSQHVSIAWGEINTAEVYEAFCPFWYVTQQDVMLLRQCWVDLYPT